MSTINPTDRILNTRFDIISSTKKHMQDRYSLSIIINFIKSNYNINLKKNVFQKLIFDICCDNLIIGTVETMYKLIYHLHKNLDYIIIKLKNIYNQEKIFWSENNYLFDKKIELKNPVRFRNYKVINNYLYCSKKLN